MTLKIRHIVGIAIALVLMVFGSGWWLGLQRGDNRSEPIRNALNEQIRSDSVVIKNQTVYISTVEQELMSLKEAKREGDIEKEELRKLNIKRVSEITRLKFQIDTLLNVSHDGEVLGLFTVETNEEVPYNVIKLPFSFNKTDKWLQLDGTFSSEGKLDIDLKMNIDVDVWVDLQRRKNPPLVTVTSENSYVNVLSIKSIRTDMPKPKKYGIGINFGYGISKNGLTPYMGLGVSYNLFTF